jgi:hypothetical protein
MKADCMLWTPEGVWLQVGGSGPSMRLSSCGQLSLASCERFCIEKQLPLFVRLPGQREWIPDAVCGGSGSRPPIGEPARQFSAYERQERASIARGGL